MKNQNLKEESEARRKIFTKEEDDMLYEIVSTQGAKNWKKITKYFPGKILYFCIILMYILNIYFNYDFFFF